MRRRSRKKTLYFNPDKIFVKWRFRWKRLERLKMAVRIISMPVPNNWEAMLISSKVIVFEANWLIIPVIDGEINENSVHALAEEFNGLEVAGFNLNRNSGQVTPSADQEPLVIARQTAEILFRWETNELYRCTRGVEFLTQQIQQFWAYILSKSP